MTTEKLILGGVFELVALIIVFRIWLKRCHKSFIARLLWSLVLLVPFFGLVAYFFLTDGPDRHPYDSDTMSGTATSVGDSSGHH